MLEQLGQGAVVASSFMIGLGFLAGAANTLSRRGTKGNIGERKVSAALSLAGFEVLEDILLPAPRGGGFTQIDHVVRLPRSFAVIETKAYRGTISDMTEDDDNWTQVLGQSSHPIPNPITQNAWHVHAVRNIIGTEVESHSFTCFSGDADFDGAPPDGVCRHPNILVTILEQIRIRQQAEIDEEMGAGQSCPETAECWGLLQAEARDDSEARRQHRKQTGASDDFRRSCVRSVSLAVLGAAALVVSWYFWSQILI